MIARWCSGDIHCVESIEGKNNSVWGSYRKILGHKWCNQKWVRKTTCQSEKQPSKKIWSKEKGTLLIGGWGKKSQVQRLLLSFKQSKWQNVWEFSQVLTLAEFQMNLIEHCILKCVLYLRNPEYPYVCDFLKFIHLLHSLLDYFCPLCKNIFIQKC